MVTLELFQISTSFPTVGGGAVGILFLKTFTYQLKLVIFRGGASNWLPVQKPPCIKTPKREVGECVSDTFF